MIPVVPFGLIFGVLAIDVGFTPLQAMGMSLIAVSYTHLTLPTNREV